MLEKMGIRSRKDMILFAFVIGITSLTMATTFFPSIKHSTTWIIDLTAFTFFETFLMTVLGSFWMGYAILGLVLQPRGAPSHSFRGKYSIVIPAKDEEAVITNILTDLKNQTYKNFEVFVVSHNCIDKTFEKVRKFRDKRVIPLNLFEKPGKSVALNYGAAHATVEIIVIMDADNRVPEDFLEKISRYFPDYDAIQTRIETGNPNFNLVTKLAELEFISFTDLFQRVRSALDKNAALGGTGEAIKKDVLEKVGYWDEWSLTEDFALFTKLTAKGYKIGWCSETAVYDEKVPWWSDFFKQRARWLRGHFQVAFTYLKHYYKKPLDFHYLIAPISILGYYFTLTLWLIFFLQLPITTNFLPAYVWLTPWVIWNLGIAIRIYRARGFKALLLFPLLFFYLYHWIAIFPYVFKVKTWPKTPHGFVTNSKS
ncbi:glycosyltransferase [Candidatus Bathyarchaeota archaeon]|nr:glycosyltransferase [Candidatus Bathyarchaeota archaeon]